MAVQILTKIGKICLGTLGAFGILGIFIFSTLASVYYFTPSIEKTSFLVLGISGPGHDSSTLTDTMIFSSISSKGVTQVSIPRDIWYQPAQAKINTLYYYGQENGLDMDLVKQGMFDILGQTIDHWVIIDFNTFQKAIDWLGGVNIYVENTFDDFKFPIAGKENDLCNGDKLYACRYETIYFEKGWRLMDGETALKFVRSRNSVGDEGTDLARSKRQEKVISAIKSKLLSPVILFDYKKIDEGLKIVQVGIKTDFNQSEILPMLKLFIQAYKQPIASYVLDGWETESGLLIHPKTHPSKQWVLLPRSNNWNQVHQFVNCFINQRDISLCLQTGK